MKIFLSILCSCYTLITLVCVLYELPDFLCGLPLNIKTPKIIKIINRINLGIFLVSGTIFMVAFFSILFYEKVFGGV